VWRAGLPRGKQIQQIATRRIKLWAKVLDPDFAHSERVAQLSLQLYDGLLAGHTLRMTPLENGNSDELRSSLYAAALLHDVGKSEGQRGHHKQSQELIQKHGTPLGWNEDDMRRASLVARFHVGPLPARRHKSIRDLLPDEQKSVILLSAILRLANALDSAHDGHIRRLKIENAPPPSPRANGSVRRLVLLGKNEALVIAAEGYSQGTTTAQTAAAERYLLETVIRRPVVIRPMKAQATR
jgi:exopolyphosphatase/pppGpp-phosphohydrolase